MDRYMEKYVATNDGHIFSKYKNLTLKEYTNKSGYRSVTLVDPATREKKTVSVHRYVAYCLVDGYEEGLVVNHIDGDGENNHPSNLEWVRQKDNIKHASSVLGTRDFNGSNHPMYGKKHKAESIKKMSEARRNMTGSKHARSTPVNMIDVSTGEVLQTFESQCLAAKTIGISQGNLGMVLSGKRNTAGEYKWEYAARGRSTTSREA